VEIRDVKTALRTTWIVVSAVFFLLAVLPFLAPAEWLFRASPVCEAKRRGSECVMCGMTTAYVAIGNTQFADARNSNAGALPLWGASIVNFSGAFAYVSIALHKRRGR
jgi:hypothetical protein